MNAQVVAKLSAADRRPLVADMYLSGKYQRQISDHFNVSQKTISNDLKAIHAEWKKEYADKWDSIVSEQLAKIDKQEREAWKAWDQSKKPLTAVGTKKGTDGKGAVDLQESSTTQRDGNPQFLKTIQWCIEQRLKIVGGYANDRRADRKQESMEKWQVEIIESLKEGRVKAKDIIDLFPDEAQMLFASAGIDIKAID